MTLVLSVATPVYALHVSDRLVSKAGTPYDPLANKTVVLRATDGLLAFGYTGPAYVEGVPTDTWIAEAVSGEPGAGDTGAGIRMGTFPVRDVGTPWCRCVGDCGQTSSSEASPARSARSGGSGTGNAIARSFARCSGVLHRGSGELRWQQIVPRHIPERKNVFRMVHTGNWPLGAAAWQRLLNQVGAAGSDVERVERLLVDAIRDASISKLGSGTIGSHCMSVLLRPWQSPHALVRFIPRAAHEAEAFGQVVAVAYSPWMVAPDAIHAPAVHVGGWTCAQGLLTYEMNSPPIPEGQRLKGAFQTQLRHSG